VSARWDGDSRGYGVGDAGRLVEGAAELVAAFEEPRWVAEQPDLHLGPHIEGWCRDDERLRLTGARSDDTGAYIVDLEWRGAPGGVAAVRAAVFCLIGSFAESATYVRQRRARGGADPATMAMSFEVGTGELAPEARFVPHGHIVLMHVTGVPR
jgi:hypothetical protein